jgi:hypothetical protein
MLGGLLLALGSAALINLGFLLQQRGLHRGHGAGRRLRGAVRDPAWLSGQALGWIGFAAQIAAVAMAPLALVQAFAAGGLALSVPLAAGAFRHPVSRSDAVAVLLIAAGLATLPMGFSTAADRLDVGSLVVAMGVGAVAGTALVVVGVGAMTGTALVPRRRSVWPRSLAAGISYGLADAAIKAVSLDWRVHGAAALLSGWSAVAVVCTFGGFLAFQSALCGDGVVAAITLMNAGAALVALACGLGAFGESLGAGAGATVAHLVAIAVVLAGLPVLAAAQNPIVESAEQRDQRPAAATHPLPAVGRSR